jgi:tyrosine-protein kinase Etk/Wzc
MAIYPQVEANATPRLEQESSVDALDVAVVLAKSWRGIAITTVVFLLFGVVLSLWLKPVYTGKAIILPPQQEQSTIGSLLGSALGSLASLGGGGGGGAAGLLKNPADMYIGILKSQTISDQLIKKFDLQQVYHQKTLEDTRKALAKHADFESQKDGLIHISVTDHDPQRASDLANGYIDALYRMNSTLALTDASQRRLFFGQQIDQEKVALNKAEDDLAATELKTGLIQMSGQAAVIISTIARVQAQIASNEVALKGMLTSATEENPQVQRLKEESAALQAQLKELQDNQKKLPPGDIEVPAGRVPTEALEYERKLRDVKFNEALYELLAKQYEAARIDEAKQAPVIQVVDRAIVPDKKSGPSRRLIVLGFVFAGFLFSCLYYLAASAMERMKQSPEHSVRLQEIRSSLRLHRQ